MTRTDLTTEYLAAYRRTIAVPAGRRTQNLAAFRARVDAPGRKGDRRARGNESDVEPVTAHPVSRAAGFLFIAKSASLSVLLGVMGLGTVKLGAMAVQRPVPTTQRGDAPADRAPTTARMPTTTPTQGAQPNEMAPAPIPAVERSLAGTVEPPPLPAATIAPQPRINADTPVRVPRPDTLRTEVDLMRRVANAIDTEQWATALNLTAQHQTTFPDGAMVEERTAWRSVAQCHLQKRGASEAAKSFAITYPRSSLIVKVEQACQTGAASNRSTDSRGRQE